MCVCVCVCVCVFRVDLKKMNRLSPGFHLLRSCGSLSKHNFQGENSDRVCVCVWRREGGGVIVPILTVPIL